VIHGDLVPLTVLLDADSVLLRYRTSAFRAIGDARPAAIQRSTPP
jgi:hypothetical protein